MTTEQDPAQLFGPPPTDGGLFTGGSILTTRTGVAVAAEQWSNGAASLDLDELSLELLEVALERPGPPVDNAGGRRASALMLARRYSEALAALPPGLVLPPPDDDDLRRDHLVAATCRAALGDDGAFAWLRQVAPLVSATDWAGYLAHCLLRVGDARGDVGLSEAALGQLQRLGDRGRRIVPRIAAELVGRRPARPGREPWRPWSSTRESETTRAVEASSKIQRAATDLLHTCSASFVSDPQPVLDAAAELERRGDRAGAALLLNVVDRTNPDVGRIRTAVLAYGDPLHRRRRGIVLGLATVALVLSVVLGLPVVGVVAILAVLAAEVLVRMPGLDRFESGVVTDYVGKLRREPPVRLVASVADEPVRGHLRADVMVVAGVVSLVVGIVVFPHALRAARTLGPAAAVDYAGLLCVLVWILGLPALVLWVAAVLPLPRRYVVPTLTGPEADCQCAKALTASGPFARAYDAAHLVPAVTPADLQPALAGSPLLPAVRGCPVTGAAWLVLTLGPENGKILLRSPLGVFPDPPAQAEGLPTGPYL